MSLYEFWPLNYSIALRVLALELIFQNSFEILFNNNWLKGWLTAFSNFFLYYTNCTFSISFLTGMCRKFCFFLFHLKPWLLCNFLSGNSQVSLNVLFCSCSYITFYILLVPMCYFPAWLICAEYYIFKV